MSVGIIKSGRFSRQAESVLQLYPVGTLYWTKNASFDPNAAWGGTWVRIKDKFIMAAGDSHALGTSGGNETIKLTTAQLPSHEHTLNSGNTSSDGTKKTAGFRGTVVKTNSAGAHYHYRAQSDSKPKNNTDTKYTDSFNHHFGGSSSKNVMYDAANASSLLAHGGAVIEYPYSADGASSTSSVAGWSDGEGNGSGGTNNQYIRGYGHFSSYSGYHGHNVTAEGYLYGKTDNTGSGSAINILPPYETAYCWERTE